MEEHSPDYRFVWALLGTLLLICYFPMLRMTGQTLLLSEDMAHGLFSVPVALFLVWQDRDYLKHPSGTPSIWALAALAFAACLGVASTLANSSTFSRFAFLISLAGCLLLLGGASALRKFIFPLSLLLFTFPIPDVLYGQLTQPLQLLATRLSELCLETLGLSVLREGNVLQLTYMKLSVVEACSGLRSLITLFFFCLVYGYFFEPRLWLRILVVVCAVPAAILVNVVRITSTGLLGHHHPEWTTGVYHESLGWAGFFVGFLLVFLAHRTISRCAHVQTAPAPQ
uniref:Eight transmembrane protein EpsH n=1 Tax=Solibacter usitatus (strain Ellin6076) TaxID=234267 RepID=Q01XJ4_SOLUE